MKARIRKWAIRKGALAVMWLSRAALSIQSHRHYGSDVLVQFVDDLRECRECRRALTRKFFTGLCDHHSFALDLLTTHGEDAYEEYCEHHRNRSINDAETMGELARALRRRDAERTVGGDE